ncbi:MerR family transcriptional regulator [Actinoplanes italicus]|uniref:DNA-binding transcriptional MerR regulator n=1 Tax=Actinoplanes italicus TaxID=113567 RepID=A0A2T0JLG0_9ACTN|nr:MerR family transcriptional regulator [Actinoplanes italicus]PRX08436.1 DNA-binding transcriptional MerR regulator [Actinoplanes italicus]GIE36680.1 MerR family transcriptional regulator [Actinoplanes italicus]
MRIGDAAAAAGTSPRALRFYEQRGLLQPPMRTHTGQRTYSAADVARVKIIRELLSLGLTIDDVAALSDHLHLLDGDRLPEHTVPERIRLPEASETFGRRLKVIDDNIARLTRLRQLLSVCHAQLAGHAPGATANMSTRRA